MAIHWRSAISNRCNSDLRFGHLRFLSGREDDKTVEAAKESFIEVGSGRNMPKSQNAQRA